MTFLDYKGRIPPVGSTAESCEADERCEPENSNLVTCPDCDTPVTKLHYCEICGHDACRLCLQRKVNPIYNGEVLDVCGSCTDRIWQIEEAKVKAELLDRALPYIRKAIGYLEKPVEEMPYPHQGGYALGTLEAVVIHIEATLKAQKGGD